MTLAEAIQNEAHRGDKLGQLSELLWDYVLESSDFNATWLNAIKFLAEQMSGVAPEGAGSLASEDFEDLSRDLEAWRKNR